ncbi:MAG: hypothetical protein ACOC8H_00270 [bacterium]
MPTIHPSAKAQTDAALTPAERRHEVAAILAAGVLRLNSHPDALSDSAEKADTSGRGKSSDSAEKALELYPPPRTHCPHG